MYKFLVKLAILIIGIYVLIQIPFMREKFDEIRVAINEKIGNVTEEVTRVKGKVEEAKEKVDATKDTVIGITDKVKDTADAVEDAFTQINKAQDLVDAMKNGEAGETAPEGSEPPAEEGTEEAVSTE